MVDLDGHVISDSVEVVEVRTGKKTEITVFFRSSIF